MIRVLHLLLKLILTHLHHNIVAGNAELGTETTGKVRYKAAAPEGRYPGDPLWRRIWRPPLDQTRQRIYQAVIKPMAVFVLAVFHQLSETGISPNGKSPPFSKTNLLQ